MVYEINFLVLQSQTAELEKIRKNTKNFVESFGAKVIEEKEYLKRKLAYEIQHENYGFFTVLRFEFKGKTNLDELKVKLNQKKEVARYIIVQADNLPSLEEQDIKKMEKISEDKKSIKSEDVEKALKEQKKAESKTAEKETVVEEKVAEKKETKKTKVAPKKEEAKEEALSKEEKKEEVKEKKEEKKPAKKETQEEKEADEKEEKEKVSLDELDKKLDEILNS